MQLATLFTVLVADRLGLPAKIFSQAETKTLSMADLRHVVRRVVVFSLVCEAIAAVILIGRFMLGYGEPFGRAVVAIGSDLEASS